MLVQEEASPHTISTERTRGFARTPSRVLGEKRPRNPSSKWKLPAFCTLVFAVSFASVSFLMVKDDLARTAAANAAKARFLQAEEAANLRRRMDLIAARDVTKKKTIARRVQKLQANFASLNQRETFVKALLKRAKSSGTAKEINAKALVTGSVFAAPKPASGLRLSTLSITPSPTSERRSIPAPEVLATIAGDADRMARTQERISKSERDQIAALKRARNKAAKKVKTLAKMLKKRGVRMPDHLKSALGGPLIELKSGDTFLDTMNALDETLASLSRMRNLADTLPHGSPVPGAKISSRYGGRFDPFTGRRAVHGGLDFKARTGTPVRATASGVVVKAGRHGGYGKLVEIDHGNGIKTRYAHLSRINVRKGQKVRRGVRVGKVGSTGRSTGPHLHYEVRRGGKTSDPLTYVRLAKKLKPYL